MDQEVTFDQALGYAIFGTGRGLSVAGLGLLNVSSRYHELFEFRPEITDSVTGWREAIIARTLYSGDHTQRYLLIAQVTHLEDAGDREGYAGHAVLCLAEHGKVLLALSDLATSESLQEIHRGVVTGFAESRDADPALLDSLRASEPFKGVSFDMLRGVAKRGCKRFQVPDATRSKTKNNLLRYIADIAVDEAYLTASDVIFYIGEFDGLEAVTPDRIGAARKRLSNLPGTGAPPSAAKAAARRVQVKPGPAPAQPRKPETKDTTRWSDAESGVTETDTGTRSSGRGGQGAWNETIDFEPSDTPHLAQEIRRLRAKHKELQNYIFVLVGAIAFTWLMLLIVAIFAG